MVEVRPAGAALVTLTSHLLCKTARCKCLGIKNNNNKKRTSEEDFIVRENHKFLGNSVLLQPRGTERNTIQRLSVSADGQHSPSVTGDIWHEVMMWDVVVGTGGQKEASVGQRLAESGQGRQCVSAAYGF